MLYSYRRGRTNSFKDINISFSNGEFNEIIKGIDKELDEKRVAEISHLSQNRFEVARILCKYWKICKHSSEGEGQMRNELKDWFIGKLRDELFNALLEAVDRCDEYGEIDIETAERINGWDKKILINCGLVEIREVSDGLLSKRKYCFFLFEIYKLILLGVK